MDGTDVVKRSAKHAAKKPRLANVKKSRRGDPLTTTPDYDADEVEFLKAVDEYKRRKGRPFPSNSEILGVLKKLGWKKVNNDDDTR